MSLRQEEDAVRTLGFIDAHGARDSAEARWIRARGLGHAAGSRRHPLTRVAIRLLGPEHDFADAHVVQVALSGPPFPLAGLGGTVEAVRVAAIGAAEQRSRRTDPRQRRELVDGRDQERRQASVDRRVDGDDRQRPVAVEVAVEAEIPWPVAYSGASA